LVHIWKIITLIWFIFLRNKIAYEGEYLNGERNGKEKNMIHGNLIFEGEYKNGKRNGKGNWKGKKYNDNGNLRFEGRWIFKW